MRRSARRLSLSLGWLILAVSASVVSAEGIERKFHAWGRFNVGASKHEKITTQSYDAEGNLETTSVTDKVTTLKIETTVEVAGSQVQSTTTLQRGFDDVEFSKPSKGTATVVAEGTANVLVDEQPIPAQVYHATSAGKIERTVTKLFYSQEPPYLLKSETTRIPVAGGPPSRTTFDVMSLEIPWKVGADLHSSAIARRIRRHPKGRAVEWSVIVSDIPGGIVAASTKEQDAQGNLLRRSVLELLDYEVK